MDNCPNGISKGNVCLSVCGVQYCMVEGRVHWLPVWLKNSFIGKKIRNKQMWDGGDNNITRLNSSLQEEFENIPHYAEYTGHKGACVFLL